MVNSCNSIITVLLTAVLCFSQVNTWVKLDNGIEDGAGHRNFGAMVYIPETDQFLLSMGWIFDRNWMSSERYSTIALRLPDPRWINLLPHDSLYGSWADSTGYTYGFGNPLNETLFERVQGYLRPRVFSNAFKSYYQYAYDSDDKCVYFYQSNRTFRYNTQTRIWDTLSVAAHPAAYQGGTSTVLWGALCYDPVNQEIVAFGGGDVDAENGHYGTWVFKPGVNTWTKLDMAVQPPPRALSQMVYDPENRAIILFGGDHLDYMFADTWAYDCDTRTWSEKHPAISPAPRAGHALLYLPKSKVVVLLGGYAYTNDSYDYGYKVRAPFEMWRYRLETNEWKLIKAFPENDTTPFCPFSIHSMMAVDSADRILGLRNGGFYLEKTTHLLNCDPSLIDEAGTLSLGVPAGTLGRMEGPYDPDWYDQDVAAPNPDSMEAFYKTLPLNTWVRLIPPKTRSAGHDWGTRVYDPDHDQIMVWSGGHSAYCGTDVPQFSPHDNRWHIGFSPDFMLEENGSGGNSGNSAYYYSFSNRPFMPAHSYRNYCYSSVHRKMVYHHYLKYTFTYDPVAMQWDSLRAANMTGDNGGYFHSSLSNSPYGAFGWLVVSGTPGFYLFDSTRAWKALPVNNGAAVPEYVYSTGGAVYDSRRDRMIILSSQTQVGQLWAYSFGDSTLVQLNPTGVGEAGGVDVTGWDGIEGRTRELVYLPAQDKVLVQGQLNLPLYDCGLNKWETLQVANGAGVGATSSVSSGYMYDPNRDLVWDVEQHMAEVYVMRVAGGYDPDSLPGVATEAKKKRPETALSASPNPFNPVVRLIVSGVSDKGGLKIYDCSGALVADLSSLVEKNHAVEWNARGRASGLYFAVLTAQGKRLVRPLVLAR